MRDTSRQTKESQSVSLTDRSPVEEALNLGRRDLRAYAANHSLTESEARVRLELAGQVGRRRSRSMEGAILAGRVTESELADKLEGRVDSLPPFLVRQWKKLKSIRD